MLLQGVELGEMIGSDNPDCRIQCFYTACLHITRILRVNGIALNAATKKKIFHDKASSLFTCYVHHITIVHHVIYEVLFK